MLRSEVDNFSKNGASLLAETIVRYWVERGYRNVKAHPYRLNEGSNEWGVRSNLVGGRPPRKWGK